MSARQGLPPPMPGQRPLPDSDPLQQWRLRRRMEQAQQSAPAVVQDFNFLSKTEQQVWCLVMKRGKWLSQC